MRPGIGSPWPAAAGVDPPILRYEPFHLGQPSAGQRPPGAIAGHPAAACQYSAQRYLQGHHRNSDRSYPAQSIRHSH